MNLLFTLLLILNPGSTKYDLGLKLEKGKTYTHNYSSEITIKQDINGYQQNIDMTVSGGMQFAVENIVNDAYVMKASYTSVSMSLSMGAAETVYSSEEGKEDPLSQVMRSMVGRTFDLTMEKTGTITNISNLDNIFNAAFENMDIEDAQKEQVLDQIKQAYGEESFKGNIEMITAILPNKSVKKGDSWTNTTVLKSAMMANMNNTFTLTDISDTYLTITGKSSITTGDSPDYTIVNGMETRYLMNGSMTTEYKIDPNTFWIIEGKVNQNLKGKVDIKKNNNLPEGLSMPMSMKTIMNITK